MGSQLDRMRAAAAKAKPVAKDPPAVEAPKDVSPKPLIVYRCGHSAPLAKEIKPEQVKGHLKSKATKLCKDCNDAEQKRLYEEAQVRRDKRPKPDWRKRLNDGRLPDKSEFHAVYHAAADKWDATLNIIGCPEFANYIRGIINVFRSMDDKYRATLPEPPPEAERA